MSLPIFTAASAASAGDTIITLERLDGLRMWDVLQVLRTGDVMRVRSLDPLQFNRGPNPAEVWPGDELLCVGNIPQDEGA